jgi:uncharacterized protein
LALSNLLRLSRMTGDEAFERAARKTIAAFSTRMAQAPFGLPQMLAACDFELAPTREIVIAGTAAGPLVDLIHSVFDPHRIVLHASGEVAEFQPAVAAMPSAEGGTTVYICENFTCQAPVTTVADLAGLLR